MKYQKVLLILILAMGVVGCNSSNPSTNSGTKDGENWPKGLTIGTGSIGGIYHAWAGSWTSILSEPVGIPMSIEVTGGGVDNAKLVSSGDADIGLADVGTIYSDLYNDNLRAMFVMYPGFFQIHTLEDSGITSIYDLTGKNFAPGPAGSSADSYWRTVLSFFDIDANIMNMGYADANDQMKDGLVDAIAFAPTGVPHPSTTEISTTHDVKIIGVSEKDIKQLQLEFPYMQLGEIPKNTYNGQDEAVETIKLWNVYFTSKDLPDSLVYELVKETFNHHEKLVNSHSSAVDTLAENIKYLSVPLHPGAYKYYQEQGLDVPEAAKPID